MTTSTIRRELSYFILIGFLATGVDFGLYWWWHHYLPFSLAKTCSFICGSCVAYLLNKFITFQQHEHKRAEIFRFITLYVGSMTTNVFSNSFLIWFIRMEFLNAWQQHTSGVIVFAFVAATGVSTVINFIGQKFWVFKR